MYSKEFFARLGKAIYNIDFIYDEYAKRSNVKSNLLWILYALNDKQPHSQKEICKNWALPRSTVNTIIKEMEQDSIVELKQIKGEKRELYIILTKKGHEYADNLLKELYAYESKVYDKIKEKSETLILNLEKIEYELNKVFKDSN